MTEPRRVGRPRKGTLEFRGKTWHARLTVTVDGESVRRWFDLGTANRAAARRKMARLVAQYGSAEAPSVEAVEAAARRPETYAELAQRVLEARRADGLRDLRMEEQREALHILPILGDRELASITDEDITDLLVGLRDQGKAHETIKHVRNILNSRFRVAWREKVIADNPVERAELPRGKVDRRERTVLTDEELVRYLGWVHPAERERMAVLERQVMACVSRCFGGLRTGDLHTLRWEALDTEGGFRFGWAPRRKTARPQKLTVPAILRPILTDWWERAGRPSQGLVFPARRGKRAGETKTKVSHAAAFRRDLRRAFGLEVPITREKRDPDGTVRTVVDGWRPAELPDGTPRAMTPRERELFEETEHTRPVDFHSWRRAFVQALAEAEVNAQQAAALAGHSSLAAHARYLHATAKARELPEAALPTLTVRVGADGGGGAHGGESFAPSLGETSTTHELEPLVFCGADGTRTRGLRRDRAPQAHLAAENSCIRADDPGDETGETARNEGAGQNPEPEVTPAERVLLAAIERASAAGEWATVAELARQLEARRRDRAPAPEPDPDIIDLDSRRGR